MHHPFINNLSDKNLEDLSKEMSNLNNKLNFAYKTGNGPLIHQLQMAIESYRSEYFKKMDELIQKQNINTKISITKKNNEH